MEANTIDPDRHQNFLVRNASDLQLAIAAQHQRVPMVVIDRPAQWLTEERPWTADNGFSIWKDTKGNGRGAAMTARAQAAVTEWRVCA